MLAPLGKRALAANRISRACVPRGGASAGACGAIAPGRFAPALRHGPVERRPPQAASKRGVARGVDAPVTNTQAQLALGLHHHAAVATAVQTHPEVVYCRPRAGGGAIHAA